jgi:hypothetical protein
MFLQAMEISKKEKAGCNDARKDGIETCGAKKN